MAAYKECPARKKRDRPDITEKAGSSAPLKTPTSTTATLTTILGHMQSIFLAMRSVEDLIQELPKDLLAVAEKDLSKVQKEIEATQVLDLIVEWRCVQPKHHEQ